MTYHAKKSGGKTAKRTVPAKSMVKPKKASGTPKKARRK